MKIAIVADWLTTQGGAEKVLLSLANLYPKADFFTSVYIPGNFPELKEKKVITSYLQKLPLFIRKRHQLLFSFLPTAIESLDLGGYDIIISSSTYVAKGVIGDENAIHICYCHTPTRYFWDEWHYFLKEGLNIPKFLRPFKRFFPGLFTKHRIWDFVSAQRPDHYIGNSEYVVRRIKKYYRRDAKVLRPPVDWERFSTAVTVEKKDYYIALGRLIPYKKFDLLVQTFKTLPNKKLKICGTGPELETLKTIAGDSKNIEFLGFVNDKDLVTYLGEAKAFLFPQNEDAGIAPMEGLCSGTPCIAFQKGGALGMVYDENKGENKKNGIFFAEQTVASLTDAIDRFEEEEQYFIDNRLQISENMKKFSTENFEKNLRTIIDYYLASQ